MHLAELKCQPVELGTPHAPAQEVEGKKGGKHPLHEACSFRGTMPNFSIHMHVCQPFYTLLRKETRSIALLLVVDRKEPAIISRPMSCSSDAAAVTLPARRRLSMRAAL